MEWEVEITFTSPGLAHDGSAVDPDPKQRKLRNETYFGKGPDLMASKQGLQQRL